VTVFTVSLQTSRHGVFEPERGLRAWRQQRHGL